jgi:hypothetical protein
MVAAASARSRTPAWRTSCSCRAWRRRDSLGGSAWSAARNTTLAEPFPFVRDEHRPQRRRMVEPRLLERGQPQPAGRHSRAPSRSRRSIPTDSDDDVRHQYRREPDDAEESPAGRANRHSEQHPPTSTIVATIVNRAVLHAPEHWSATSNVEIREPDDSTTPCGLIAWNALCRKSAGP